MYKPENSKQTRHYFDVAAIAEYGPTRPSIKKKTTITPENFLKVFIFNFETTWCKS